MATATALVISAAIGAFVFLAGVAAAGTITSAFPAIVFGADEADFFTKAAHRAAAIFSVSHN